MAAKLTIDLSYLPARKKKVFKQHPVKALMMASPASENNAAASIGSEGEASKNRDRAPISAQPAKPLVLPKPPTPTNSGGKCTGKGKGMPRAGNGNTAKKRNAPTGKGGGKASPGKTGGTRAKPANQSDKGNRVDWALQLTEKGFSPQQITSMFDSIGN